MTNLTDPLDFDSPVFEYLDGLRDSGVTNMYGAGPYLEAEFGLDRHTARSYLTQWMQSYAQRHELVEEVAPCG